MEWRSNKKGDPTAQNLKKEEGGKREKSRKEKITAAVERKITEKIKEEEEKQVKEDEARTYIMGLLNLEGSSNSDNNNNNNNCANTKSLTFSSSQTGLKVTLQGILRNAKNGK